MKSIILYSTTEKPIEALKDDYSIHGSKDTDGKIHVVYIRGVVIEADPVFALDKADPRRGEIVLNSIPLP